MLSKVIKVGLLASLLSLSGCWPFFPPFGGPGGGGPGGGGGGYGGGPGGGGHGGPGFESRR